MKKQCTGTAAGRGPIGLGWRCWAALLLVASAGAARQPALSEPAEPAEPESEPAAESQIVVYEPEFFARYDPVTALDMVRQVPGFKLERTSPFGNQPDVRGFGAAAVNVLINGKRPSTKSDSMESLLGRIAANEVLHLELIRGATAAGDRDITQGTVVVNVVLAESTGGRDPSPWEGAFHWEDEALVLRGEIAFSTQRGSTRYLAGLKRQEWDWNLEGPERFQSSSQPAEDRDEVFFREGEDLILDLKTATELSGGGALRLNLTGSTRDNDDSEISDRRIESGGTELFLRSNDTKTEEIELGGDFERDLSAEAGLKLIALVRRTRQDGESGLAIDRADGGRRVSRSPRSSDSGESIGRLELGLSRWSAHTLKFGGELVHNFVESASDLLVDDGDGPVEIDVPGSDTRVEERRIEAFVSDSWRLSDRLTLDLAFGYEKSEIEQSGDVDNSRSFTYPKPSASLVYSPSPTRQWRFLLERQVAQLDFFDFVSSSNFEDLDLDFGNPELRPERTWHLTSAHERRYGDIGVLGIELFYDRIDDVEDLLPVGEGFEIVGNIGDGERWGGGLDFTVPLGFLGLGDSRADVSYEIQKSSVTDPVTGLTRELSGESDQRLEVSVRKDLPKRKLALGADYNWSSAQTAFGFDEVVSETQRSHLNVHIEARLGKRTKLRFEAFNLVDDPRRRRRTVFTNTRQTGLVDFREARSRVDGQWFRLTFSGLF